MKKCSSNGQCNYQFTNSYREGTTCTGTELAYYSDSMKDQEPSIFRLSIVDVKSTCLVHDLQSANRMSVNPFFCDFHFWLKVLNFVKTKCRCRSMMNEKFLNVRI